MSTQSTIREFGAPKPAPALRVVESVGQNALSDPRYGTAAFWLVAKRGPMGVPVPVNNRRQYNEIFGDPTNPKWHLFPEGDHLGPDAVDSYFSVGGGAGMLFLTRLDLDGKARKAELTINGRTGSPVLKVLAANEGRWAGYRNKIDFTTVVVATERTFTLVAPNVLSNEFKDAIVEFSGVPGKKYVIVSNTEAEPRSGEAMFTVGAQYNLLADGVTGPAQLTGTATYNRYKTLAGTVAYEMQEDITGTITINGDTLTGTGTTFTAELKVGANIHFAGETRVVESVTSDTTLTISAPFTGIGTGLTMQRDSVTLIGTGTSFTTELAVGGKVYATINGQRVGRRIAAIASATSLTLTSGYPEDLSAGTQAETDNLTVTGTGTQFTTQVVVGQYLIDPNRAGDSVKVTAIASATSLTVEKAFPGGNFTGAKVARQNQKATVYLEPKSNEGLSVVIGQGVRYPATHFSMDVYFNGSNVLSIQDASLDPNDEQGLFVETVVSESNLAFRTGDQDIVKWITVESLWDSAYTTARGSDVRPANGSGVATRVDANRIYTVGNFDYAACIGNLLYPDVYGQPRSYVRVKESKAPATLSGTCSSLGTAVTGTGTLFTQEAAVGEYLYDPATKSVRRIDGINSDTSITLQAAFDQDMAALTKASIAGYLQVDQGYDLGRLTTEGNPFMVQYPQFLGGGYDSDLGMVIPYYFTKFADIDRNHLESAVYGKNLGLVRMACPGISDVAVQKAFANYASAKAFEFRCEIPRTYNTAAAAEAFVQNELGRDDFISVAFPSYGYQSNPLGPGVRMISLTGEIFGGESKKAATVEGWHDIFAGVNAILPSIIKIPFEPLPGDEAILNAAGIQIIKTQSGKVVVWGARVPSRSAVYDFLHIRRIQSNLVRVFMEARPLLELLFRPNSPELAEQAILTLNNFARREYRKGVFTNYLTFNQAVQIEAPGSGSSAVTDIDSQDAVVALVNGRLEIAFRYVPTGIVEQLFIHCGPEILVAQYGKTN